MKKFMVFIAAVAMVGLFAFTAVAAEWNFYGHSRMTTVYYDKAKEHVAAGALFDDQDLTWNSQTNARLGAKVKASDTVSGRFEFQTGQAVGLRLMYGTWNFGPGTLLVGQDYTPTDTIISASIGNRPDQLAGYAPPTDGEGNALWIGSMYTSRIPQLKLTFDGFQVALIRPSTTGASGVYTDVDTTLPKIEMSYKFATDAFSVKPYFGYQTVAFSDPATDNDVSIDSYIYGAQFGVNMGPAYIKGNLFGATNPGNYGRLEVALYNAATVTGVNVDDADVYGGILLVGFKLNDMFKFEAGYAMDKSKTTVLGVESKNDPSHWYVNTTITMAPGVFIVPEIGRFDYGDNEVAGVPSVDQGDVMYYGAKWQINF
jgi:hypothetical protein